MMMIQAGGEWTITSVLHDATAVVSFFSASLILHNTLVAAYVEFWIEFHYINWIFGLCSCNLFILLMELS